MNWGEMNWLVVAAINRKLVRSREQVAAAQDRETRRAIAHRMTRWYMQVQANKGEIND